MFDIQGSKKGMDMLIVQILERNARMYGEEVALIEREPSKNKRTEITWREFDDLANRFSNALREKGVGKGDRVIHLMVNCLEWLPAYFGILRTGALAVPLNFRFSAQEIGMCISMAEPRAIIFGKEFVERINEIKGELGTIEYFIFSGPDQLKPEYSVEYEQILKDSSPVNPDVEIGIEEEAALYFTSGTTGTPKPILLTHRNLEAACIVENRHHNQTHEDNFLCIPPLYHTGAKMHWFGNFIVGARAVILKGVRPDWILRVISEEGITIVWLLVPWAQDILMAVENGDVNLSDYSLDQWRLMHIGAQPVPPSLIRKWKKIFPGHEYDTNYGLSEASGPGCVHLGMENTHKIGAIGVPGFDWECRIVDNSLNPLPGGSTGELMVKGPGVMKEYYKAPKETARKIRNGWLLTGDMAKMDEDGFIWLVDRKKDIIIVGGENIYPVEIEDFLSNNDNIQDVAVIGIPNERLGEIPAAVIKVKPGRTLSEQDINSYCEQLPRYKRPRRIIFGEVPRNSTGKIQKPKLRKIYRDEN